MIIGNYYINNFLVAAIVLVLIGGMAYFVGFPGGGGEGEGPGNVPEDFELVAQGEGLSSGGSQVMRLVSSNGTAINGADVFVNGEEIGETGENGQVTFQVPDSSNVTVSASKSGVEVTRTFELDASGEEGEQDEGTEDDEDEKGQEGDTEEDNETGGQEEGENETDSGDKPVKNETESNETTIEASIEKVQPESQQLDSTGFETVLELASSNASYSVKLEGEEQASGEIDGEVTVSPQLSVPGNGSFQLNVEITRQDQVLASQNYTFNYSEPSGNETDQTEEEASVTAILDAPGQIQVGEAASFDASGSSGDIVNYSWSLGDGSQETTQSATVQHSYSSEDTYEVTLTVNGENNTEDSASAMVDVLGEQAPIIDFLSPVNGYETDQSSLTYEFEVDNAASDAQYTVLIDESGTASGSLEQGNNTVQETIDIPETLFNTSIRVQQGGETYSSDKRTVNASSSSVSQPVYSLNSPNAGETVEIVDSQTNLNLEYEISNRKWATSATLKLENSTSVILDTPVSAASGSYSEEVSGLELGSYNYSLKLEGNGKIDQKASSFNIEQVQPYYEILNWNEYLLENGYEVNFDITYNVSDSSQLEANIFNTSGTEVRSYSRFIDGHGSLNFNKTFMNASTYNWYINITDGENIEASTKPNTRQFQTEESNPNDN
jgi:hypothetical protein